MDLLLIMMALTLSITLLKFAQKKISNFALQFKESAPQREANVYFHKKNKTANTEYLLLKKRKKRKQFFHICMNQMLFKIKHIATTKNIQNL